MKKIIIITPHQIWPIQSGGQVRTASLAIALKKRGHKIIVYCLTGRKGIYLSNVTKRYKVDEIDSEITQIINLSWVPAIIQFISYKIGLDKLLSFLSVKFFHCKLLELSLIESDHLIIDYPYLYPIAEKINLKYVLNTHNYETERYALRIIKNLIKKIETNAYKQSDIALFTTNKDLLNISNGNKRKTDYIITNTAITNLKKEKTSLYDNEIYNRVIKECKKYKHKFIFVGSMYGPNLESLSFLKKFLKNNKRTIEEMKILILVVGNVSKLAFKNNFICTGIVRDLEKYYKLVNYAINPIFSGSGSNIKIAEYIKYKIPIFSTQFGVRGYQLEDKKNYIKFERQKTDTILKQIQESESSFRDIAEKALLANKETLDITNQISKIGLF